MPETILKNAKAFGVSLGLAFQLIDDTLDYSEVSLKDQELDLKNGIVNSVVFELLLERDDLMKRFKNGEDLTGLLTNIDIKPYVEKISIEAMTHLEDARKNLTMIEEHLSKYTYQSHEGEKLKSAIESIEVVMSYMALRTL